jgi:hypothetical protein
LLGCLAKFFLEEEMFQTKVAEKIKIHISCQIHASKNHAVYKTIMKNTTQPVWPVVIKNNMVSKRLKLCAG